MASQPMAFLRLTASNGLTINVDASIQDISYAPMVIVCSSFDPQLYVTPKILAWLRRLSRLGASIGGVETGSYILARAGLLDDYRATIHWENTQSITEAFPKVRLTGRIFEIDRDRFSASGAAAAMDMMLHFIAVRMGRKVASAVAEEFIYNRMRAAESPQRLTASERMNTRQPRLRRLLNSIDKDLERRLDVGKLASKEGISQREIRRLFQKYLGSSPQAYHRILRLQKAQSMLRQTDKSISEVALACGFTSSSDFSRAYRRQFRCRPLEDRREIYQLDPSSIMLIPGLE
ncbi:MAG TPA: GlxA family transcriptional regulator [Candidatus Binatia bacterium]|nr:GlxA family transcriptional regulator [Candidatus Binatia bacterium]